MSADAFTAQHRGGSGTPLVLLHGFTDTWRTWDLVLPALQRRHDVLAPTLAGHAGGPRLTGPLTETLLVEAIEQAMDDAGFATAHIAGNSLGGYLALQLAARGRARSVVALAPAGGWADGDESFRVTLDHFTTMQELLSSPRRGPTRSSPRPRDDGARRRSPPSTSSTFPRTCWPTRSAAPRPARRWPRWWTTPGARGGSLDAAP